MHQLQTLRELFANLLALGVSHRLFQLFIELVEVDFGEKFLDPIRAHASDEIFAVLFLRFAIFDLI